MKGQVENPVPPERSGGPDGFRRHRMVVRLLAIFIATVMIGANAGMWLYNRTTRPGAVQTSVRMVTIRQGSTAKTIAKEFLPRRFDRILFCTLARMRGMDQSLRYGTYRVSRSMSLCDLIDVLAEGVLAESVKVTLPEGFTIEHIASTLAEKEIVAADEFILAANDPKLAALLGVPAGTLEGYLFPDTYQFLPETSAEDVIRILTARFRQVMADERGAAPAPAPEDLYDIVTVASIIEREALLDEEKPLVAAVIYNRLARGMRLQCDATIRYGLKQYDKHLTYAELDADTPYNSYLHNGLPPTPICNPGRKSLRAALRPVDNDHLYFVSRNNGTHEFSRTLEEHNDAVRKYQGITRYRRR